jgi:hypothetical protein
VKGSPKKSPKKRKIAEQLPPITVVFEDIENFSATVLQDFIVTCRYVGCSAEIYQAMTGRESVYRKINKNFM